MRRLLGLWTLTLGLTFSRLAAAATLTPTELLTSPDAYLGKTVEARIVESLYGPSTPEALARSEYGSLEVVIPDFGGKTLHLVPAAYKAEDPKRFKNKFDRPMKPPVRVTGEFLQDKEMSESLRRPYYVIRVVSWEAAPSEAPVATILAQIKVDPAKWDRKTIVYEGVYENRFEVSGLDKDIWLGFREDTELVNKPANQMGAWRVRVTGTLFSKPGARYGHLGGYSFELVASKIEFLK
jgi:hypothetical protein